jgi:hypothetical protein
MVLGFELSFLTSRQVFYDLNLASSPFSSGYFEERESFFA